MKARRPLTKGELALWRKATSDVRPLIEPKTKNETLPPPSKTNVDATSARPAPKATPKLAKANSPVPRGGGPLDPSRPIDIDRRSWARLKRGQVEIERTLDLHGRTQTEAHGALNRFLTMAYAAGLRCVLVVTGKGGSAGRGVLRQMVPRWLGEATHRPYVLTFCPAQPKHGGDGALYILLRRRRNGREQR
ncbi:MAG: Smr/MutS family protein [Pseudomonadota bacterium]